MRNRGLISRTLLVVASISIMLAAFTACTEDENESDPGQERSNKSDSGSDSTADKSTKKEVTVHFWGHACFSVVVEDGTGVVTDPYPSPTVEPEVVTVSHEHFDHNQVENVPGDFEVIRGVGEREVGGITFTGVATFHDDVGGTVRGDNTVFVWEMEGIHFAHLGDLGHLLTNEQLEAIGEVDVLMIPVGGVYTIDGPMAVQVAQQLSARLIIPMHYTAGETGMLDGVDVFLDAAPDEWVVEQLDSPSITTSISVFETQEIRVVVLTPLDPIMG